MGSEAHDGKSSTVSSKSTAEWAATSTVTPAAPAAPSLGASGFPAQTSTTLQSVHPPPIAHFQSRTRYKHTSRHLENNP